MTAATINITNYSIGALATKEQLLNALKNALILAGWTILNDTVSIGSGNFRVDMSRTQNASAKGTLYLRISTSSAGGMFTALSSDTADFAAVSNALTIGTLVANLAVTSWSFLSCLHPEAQTVSFSAQENSSFRYGAIGAVRPIQKPSWIDENIFNYGIMMGASTVGAVTYDIWGAPTAAKNPNHPSQALISPTNTNSYSPQLLFNQPVNQREIYPSLTFRNSAGWYGTTSADIVICSAETIQDDLILSSGAIYKTMVPSAGYGIRKNG